MGDIYHVFFYIRALFLGQKGIFLLGVGGVGIYSIGGSFISFIISSSPVLPPISSFLISPSERSTKKNFL